jgi:hypothetical protein
MAFLPKIPILEHDLLRNGRNDLIWLPSLCQHHPVG